MNWRLVECGGKGAAVDTALDFQERQNILGRSTNQSGVDAQALPPQSKGALDRLIRGCDLKFLIRGMPAVPGLAE